MYAKYNYIASGLALAPVQLRQVHDVAMILCGESNKANLSPNCDQANTLILNSIYPTAWEFVACLNNMSGAATTAGTGVNTGSVVFNKGTTVGLCAGMPVQISAVGTSGLTVNGVYWVTGGASLLAAECLFSSTRALALSGVSDVTMVTGATLAYYDAKKVLLRAPILDGAPAYKYISLDALTVNGSYQNLTLALYEGYALYATPSSPATVMGTTLQQRVSATTAGTVTISANQRMCVLQSNVVGVVGSSANAEWNGVFERTRLSPWDTVANAYPPTVSMSGTSFTQYPVQAASYPKSYNPIGGTVITTAAVIYPMAMGYAGAVVAGGGVSITLSRAFMNKIPDGLGGFYTPRTSFGVSNSTPAVLHVGGMISEVCDVWQTVSYPNNLDEITAEGKQYILLQNALVSGVLHGFLAVPKG